MNAAVSRRRFLGSAGAFRAAPVGSHQILGAIVALLGANAALGAPERVTLDGGSIRLEWDARTGELLSLANPATKREWLDRAAAQPLYAIKFAGAAAEITPKNAVSIKAWQEPDAVRFECVHDQPAGLTVSCRFRKEPGSEHLLGTIGYQAAAPVAGAEIRFPGIALKLPFSDTGDGDRVLRPECDGSLLSNPGFNRRDSALRYPGMASLQMMAAFDATAGLYLAARDTRGQTKSFCSRSTGKALELSIRHNQPRVPVTSWELGYEVDLAGLRPAAGTRAMSWEVAAEVYRTWAIQQPWCRQTSAQRVASGAVPSWLGEPSLVLTYSLRGQLPDGTVGNRIPLLVEQADRWREVMGVPVTCLIISWEKLDTWVTPDYFPPYGGDAGFAALTQALHQHGHRTMVFLSGLHWTLHKELADSDRPQVKVDQQAEFEGKGRASAICGEDGMPEIHGKPGEGIGQHATICAATPLAREILQGTARRCQALGIDCVQVDQIVGGGMRDCFQAAHGHPPGGGGWCTDALLGLFEDIRKAGKAGSQDFAFSIEEPNECYLPLLDTYHARDLHQGRWPRSGAGVLGVPLFTHVYHDYCAGYGSEGCYASERPSQMSLYQIGMNLVCGKTPAVALWGRWLEPEKLEANQRRLLRAHLDLWRGPAGEFLRYGQRLAPPELEVPIVEMLASEKDGKTQRRIPFPAVLAGAWRLADGRTGTVFAGVGPQQVEFEFAGEKLMLGPGDAVFRQGK